MKDVLLSHLDDLEIDLNEIEQIDDSSDGETQKPYSEENGDDDSLLYSIYSFDNLRDVISVANMIASAYKGDSSLYKSPFNNKYYLSLCMPATDEHILNKICSILTENGHRETPTYAKELFYMEHFEEIVANKAIEKLGKI